MTRTVLENLARFVAEDPLAADAETIETVRNGVVDTFGCILAGANEPVARKARNAVEAMGTTGEANVIGTGLRTGLSQAAFLNALAGHALEFDDWEVPGNTHPTVVLLPALLACAREDTCGRDLIEGYLAGFEVIARLGEALNFEHYDRGWHSTATLGAIGAAAAVARLLGLDASQATSALSLAVSRATGYTCQFGSDAKAMQAGFAAQTGVEAAHLARAGVTGRADVLDHAKGMNALMANVPDARLKEICARLGNGLALTEHKLILKPWPSCGYTHRIMTAALSLARRRPETSLIARIDLHLPDFHAAVLPFTQPARREEALFSAPFVAAMGLSLQRLGLDDIKAERWKAPEIKALMSRTQVHTFAPSRPDLNYDPEEPDRVLLTLSCGQTLEQTCAFPLGAPENPMTPEDVRAKFSAIAPGYAASRIESLFDWPTADRVAEIFVPLEHMP